MPSGVRVLWVGTHAPAGVPATRPAQAGHHLGSECDVVVFEAGTPVAGDALAVAAGLLRGGGILLLLVEAAAASGGWTQRWQAALRAPVVEWVEDPPDHWPLPSGDGRGAFAWTPDQVAARRLLDTLGPGECRVLTAPRGRGKSTLLGDWMAAVWADSGACARLTGPTERAVRAVRAAARARLGALPPALDYRAPGMLEAAAERPGTLVVDEAAALPVDQLLRLAGRARCLVLATTTGGFEGSGQGFRLRVLPALEQAGFRVRQARLETPVRWGAADPLEDWLDALFLLRARSAVPAPQAVRWRWGAAAGLVDQPPRLEAVAGLLADAHYRTRPSDLQRWLEDPAMRLLTLEGAGPGDLFGAVLVTAEPGLERPLAEAVWAGERRPQGHFLPCVLAGLGALDLAGRPVWRIQRIAVHPLWQGRGLGRRLLRAIADRARAERVALLGASFGLDAGLLGLWRRAGFDLVRVGLRPDPASGRPGGVVLRAVDAAAGEVRELAAAQARDWPAWRERLWPGHEAALADALERVLPEVAAADPMPARDWQEIRAFAERARPLEWALPALLRRLGADPPSDAEGRLLAAALQERPMDWEALAMRVGVSGRRGVVRRLRQAVRAWQAGCDWGCSPEAAPGD